mmetsp:Transcript_40286/g.99624  ORF Transcript_40286/g.99624 Transcript_40286/m.99624 type:complete len:236 (-) Transcript_40286:229-936(-)
MVGADESLNLHAPVQQHLVVGEAHLTRVVAGDHAAECDARAVVHRLQHGLGRDSACVVEVLVDPVGRRGAQRRNERHLAVLIGDGSVEAKLARQPLCLGVRPHDADHARATHLSELARQAADGTSTSADDDRVARLHVKDVVSAHPRRQTDNEAQHGEVRRERHVLAHIHGTLGRARHIVLLQPADANHVRADGEGGLVALLHHADRGGAHRLAEGGGHHVLSIVRGPDALGGVE